MALLVANRSEASHFAGGLVLNANDESARFSNDFDLFHDVVADLAAHSEADVAALATSGYTVEKLLSYGTWDRPTSFRKAVVRKDDNQLEIDWAHDSAFRFFPIVPDPLLGWRLHLFDMATNKALALSARTETRDYIDIVELGRIYPLEAIIWAACGKDEGFSPQLLLAMMRRFAKISPGTVEKIKARDLDPIALKIQWIEMSDRAEAEITRIADAMPDLPPGVAFVNEQGEPGWIGTDSTLKLHHGSIRGCWPMIHGIHVP
ncbi:hypothetical protein [Luteolibacter sp. Populi]|uniref:hypothetical protein n=1 Tax=Luteolibacter sp. Populi TaxID=3230487 RepID=UPI0034657FEE